MAEDNVDIELKKKRVISKQTLRDNPNHLDCSIEHYYCVTVFLPYVDYYLMQLTERFINHKAIFEGKYIICIIFNTYTLFFRIYNFIPITYNLFYRF